MALSARVRTYLTRDAFMLKGAEQMSISDFRRCALGFCAAFAILAGCAQSQLAPSGPFQQSNGPSGLGQLSNGLVNTAMRGGLVIRHANQDGRSWMAPGAATHALLYVSDYIDNEVFVYSYPEAKLVGTLTGFHGADGICADKKGDVWIVNNYPYQSGENVVEYKHGGTKPIATVYDPAYSPVGCSVDPITGDLAVSNVQTFSGGSGNLALFAHAKGTPKLIPVSNMYYVYFCGYDNKGNLFVDGEANSSTGFRFAELPKGKTKFKDITLDAPINFPGNIRWDGKYLAVGDQEYHIYPEKSAIYQTTGAGGKIVGKTAFSNLGDIGGFTIDGKTVIGPLYCQNGCMNDNGVDFYNYPAGGKPIKKFTNKNFMELIGSAISP
jgi:hypothetical protein